MLGQRGDGKLLLDVEDRALRSPGLPDQGAGQGRRVRLHRAVLQPVQETLKIELPQPGSIRGAAALKGLGKASGKSGEAQCFARTKRARHKSASTSSLLHDYYMALYFRVALQSGHVPRLDTGR